MLSIWLNVKSVSSIGNTLAVIFERGVCTCHARSKSFPNMENSFGRMKRMRRNRKVTKALQQQYERLTHEEEEEEEKSHDRGDTIKTKGSPTALLGWEELKCYKLCIAQSFYVHKLYDIAVE